MSPGGCPDPQQEILHDLLRSIGQIRESIGQLQGTVKAIQEQRQETLRWLIKLDERLRTVERRAAVNGMIAGGVVTTVLAAVGYFFQSHIGG